MPEFCPLPDPSGTSAERCAGRRSTARSPATRRSRDQPHRGWRHGSDFLRFLGAGPSSSPLPPCPPLGRSKLILGLALTSKFLPTERAALTARLGQFWTTPRKPPSRTRGWNSASLDAPHTRPICPCLSRHSVRGAVGWLRPPCCAASQPSSRRSWPLVAVALSSLTAMPAPRTRRLSMPRMQRGQCSHPSALPSACVNLRVCVSTAAAAAMCVHA